MDSSDRPVLWCFVSYPIHQDNPEWWTTPALVSLVVAEELKQKGYMVVGPDPQDERDLAMLERLERAMAKPRRNWFDAE